MVEIGYSPDKIVKDARGGIPSTIPTEF
jgi:hypothetical protein